MQVKQVMTKDWQIVGPDCTLEEAARLMRDEDIGFLPVGENDRLQGVVTDRDIVVRAIAEGEEPAECVVSDILSEGVLYCFEDDDIRDAARNMREQQVYRLIVLNNRDEKRLCGIVTLGDIARQTEEDRLVGDTTQGVAEQVRSAA